MSNQTQHTPLSPSPLGRGLGGGLSQKMKPITIPPEMQDLVKKINKLATTVIPELEKSEEENRKRELKKQQNKLPDYTEVAGIKVLTKDLGKPQCPEVKFLRAGQKYKECCCYELEHDWEVYYQYDFHGALKEAEFRGIEVLSDNEWYLLEKELGVDGLKDLLNLKKLEDYRGYYNNIGDFLGEDEVYYWASPTNVNCSWICNLCYFNNRVISYTDDVRHLLSVRCRLKD